MSKKQVICGGVPIGGGAPVSIQSMTNVDSRDEKGLLRQIDELVDAGCEIVRIAVPDSEAAEVFGRVKAARRSVPLVADIHFDYRLAIAAVYAGADKIRINPGNVGGDDRVRAVVEAAKERNIPIRVGVNSGSLEKDILKKYGGVTAEGLAESALRNMRRIEDMGYDNLVVSAKASSVAMTYETYKLLAAKTEAPLHIGVTEAGTLRSGSIKSAAGLGALLLSGIGDTVRVSLTADPTEEVRLAKDILQSVGLREAVIDFVSCPTCGRTRIDLQGLADKVQKELLPWEKELAAAGRTGLKIAIMGCAVNGPGEAKDADFGVAGGKGSGLIFAGGRIIKTVREEELAEELVKTVRESIGV